MTVQSFREHPRPIKPFLSVVENQPQPTHLERAWELAHHLVAEGTIGVHALQRVIDLALTDYETVGQAILSLGLARDPDLTRSFARHSGLEVADPVATPPATDLIERLGAEACLRFGVLPWANRNGVICVLVAEPGTINRRSPLLRSVFGPVCFAFAPRDRIDAAILRCRGNDLRRRAETRAPAGKSCRGMARCGRLPVLTGAAICSLAIADPGLVLTAGLVCAMLMMVMTTVLNASALIAALRRVPQAAPARGKPLPKVSVIIALYREADIAARLLIRLSRLDYPRDRLEVIIALEEDDAATRHALSRKGLPPWMRLLIVPGGSVRTKPLALNYALPLCRGSIIGVYDAEDAPDPQQIRTVADQFDRLDPGVACLQGVLDFYNPRRNWLSRAFTVEYAAWFRVVLPGLSRLRLPVPLGGSTLFFRREVLEEIGGWDAHNVTEDADLGIRLIRHGYRTELIRTVTREEANCHPAAWVRQRSRWIKGYMMTWRVHMRRPRQLWRDLGPRGFIAFNMLFLGSVGQAAMFPVFVLLWGVSLGLADPLPHGLPDWSGTIMIGLGLLSEAVRLTLAVIGLRDRSQRSPAALVLLPHLVQPLASLAAYRAFWELLRRPFHWDKTQHGRPEADVT